MLRRVPFPPPLEQVSQHRTLIVSSSLDHGSPAERISSSLALCLTFDLASALSLALSSDRAFFFGLQSPRTAGLTTCRCVKCMAGMLTYVLLTKRSKSICVPVAGDAAPYPPPSDPRLGDTNLSRILLPRLGFTGLMHILLPCIGPKLQIWLRPYHKAPTSVGASFFALNHRPAPRILHGSVSQLTNCRTPAFSR